MFEPKPIEDFDGSRVNSLGASDMPTLALLNKRWGQTPYTLWQEKTGRAEPFRGNARTYWGHMLEGLVLRQFVKNHDLASPTGFYMAYLARKYKARRNIRIYTEFRHPDYPWAMSHPDLVVLGDIPRLQEAKTAGFFGARRDDDPDFGYSDEDFSQEGIPAAVFLQVQWQLFTAGIREGGVSLLADTANYREYGPIIADPRTQEKLLALGERFMWHVKNDEPPKPEIWADVVSLYPEVEETTAMVGGDELSMATQMIEEYHDAAKKIKKLEARREEVKNALGLWIGGNKVLVSSEGAKLASQGEVNAEYFDLKKLRAERPELYEELKGAGFVNGRSWRNLYISKLK